MPSPRFIRRRTLLRGAACVTVAAPVPHAPRSAVPGGCFTTGSERIRIGVVGCGGRGTGAAAEAVEAARLLGDRGVSIVAVGDASRPAIERSVLMLSGRLGAGFDVPADRRFVGLDACERVCAAGVDLVVLAGPASVRPGHVAMAVARGLHVYAERPLAVDLEGLAMVAEAGRGSAARGLSFVTSLPARYDAGVADAIVRVQSLGDRVREITMFEHAGASIDGRGIDAVDVALSALGGRAEDAAGWRGRSTSRGLELMRGDGCVVRVVFDRAVEQHGRSIVRHDGGSFEFVTPADRRRATATGLAAAWAAMLGSIRRGSPVNDCRNACVAHAAVFAASGHRAAGMSGEKGEMVASPFSRTA